jgi:uroporphyrinogen-III synthase
MTPSLRGKRVVITRPASQAQSFIDGLSAAESVPILFPTIQIAPIQDNPLLDSALRTLSRYDWIVFTSVNGVHSVLDRMTELGMRVAALNSASVAGIGPATVAALRNRGVQVDLQPAEYVAEAIFTALNEREVIDGSHFLLLRADIARVTLREQLSEAGGIVEEIPVYQTVRGEPDPGAFAELRRGVDVITFTSSSTVRYFFELLPDARDIASRARIVCIGPITAQTARDFGLTVALVAESYTVDGLLTALLEH